MRLSRVLALAAALAVMGTTPALAQRKSDGLTGTRVRVTAPSFLDQRITGTVTSFTADGLTVRDETTGSEYSMPLKAVYRLDPFMGDSRASTAWWRGRVGAFIGASVGLIAGPFLSNASDLSFGQTVALSGATGLIGGASIGAISGSVFPGERWNWIINPWGYDRDLKPSR